MVSTPTGATYRRNRMHLQLTPKSVSEQPVFTSNQDHSSPSVGGNSKTVDVQSNAPVASPSVTRDTVTNNNPVITRSGRVVKPKLFEDFVT